MEQHPDASSAPADPITPLRALASLVHELVGELRAAGMSRDDALEFAARYVVLSTTDGQGADGPEHQ